MPLILEPVIGLEVHAQVSAQSKMFCGCRCDTFGLPPNTAICPICTGHPGTLPVPNIAAVTKAVHAALALGCTVQHMCHFDRKHYFYPDLPAGFQISQYDFPLAKGGMVVYDILDASGRVKSEHRCRITRLHLENDAGKLSHHENATLVDFNRAGTPLMEIVTEPDLQNGEEAVAFAQELRRILIAVAASAADMYKGMMRFDASISLREAGTRRLNPRSEIKNLNSFRSLERALAFEEQRLRTLWEKTGQPLPGNVTVGWLDDEGCTRVLREKEEAQDYRYFPEPDIPPLTFTPNTIAEAKRRLPPLPREVRKLYHTLGLSDAQALQILDEPQMRAVFDAVYDATKDAGRTCGLVLTQLAGFLNAAKKTWAEAPSAEAMLALVAAINAGTISGNAGKDVLAAMIETGKDAATIIAERGFAQISDTTAIEEFVTKAIAANPQAVASFRAGKPAALGAIVGWVMKETKGQANPTLVNTLLQKHLL